MTRAFAAMMAAGLAVLLAAPADAQTRRRAPAPAPKPAAMTTSPAEITCPTELGTGVSTRRQFCDVLTGRDPAAGVLVRLPAHTGPAYLIFDLHNRQTYSEEQVKAKKAFARYTASIGVLTLDNTLISRAVIDSEFRTSRDLVDRVSGGAGPGGVKAVAPTGTEPIRIEIPEGTEVVSILGERLTVTKPDGTETFSAPGRPIAVVSNVTVEYRPAKTKPKPKPPVKKKQLAFAR